MQLFKSVFVLFFAVASVTALTAREECIPAGQRCEFEFSCCRQLDHFCDFEVRPSLLVGQLLIYRLRHVRHLAWPRLSRRV